jgi:hypothetical protein
MALSDDDKRRIEDEEVYRLRLRHHLEQALNEEREVARLKRVASKSNGWTPWQIGLATSAGIGFGWSVFQGKALVGYALVGIAVVILLISRSNQR